MLFLWWYRCAQNVVSTMYGNRMAACCLLETIDRTAASKRGPLAVTSPSFAYWSHDLHYSATPVQISIIMNPPFGALTGRNADFFSPLATTGWRPKLAVRVTPAPPGHRNYGPCMLGSSPGGAAARGF
ncbi:hypothetical protein RRG08_053335 [Elysia crispata]|uniref:Uncharacterized protein n=1 Tax=Elysia crispata TaxID=231223 RepID=A0AAE0ZKH8_9GAST|nr:hypothetical protein RRG08_053335 [Elysia crispata]